MKKMDKRKRQHPLWIGYKFFQTLKFIFIPTSLLFIYYYETKASWTSIAWIGIILVITFQLIICIFQWKHHTYFITDTNLELCEGMFTRKKRNIPLNRIQRFEQFDTIFHRIFRLHSLHLIVESTYSKQSTIILPMVSQEDAKNVIRVFENLNPQFNDLVGVDGKKNIIYQLKKTELFAYSVTSLYLICTFLIFNFFVQKLTHIVLLHDNVDYVFYVVIRFGTIIVITFITIYLFASLLYSIVMFIRHGDYTIEMDRNNLYITKGTRTKSTYLIPINHINGIIIENTFPKRLFSYVSFKIIV